MKDSAKWREPLLRHLPAQPIDLISMLVFSHPALQPTGRAQGFSENCVLEFLF